MNRPIGFGRFVTVKDRVGRTRYVAFAITHGAPQPRSAIAGALPEGSKLTRFDGTYGIVRTTQRDRDLLVAVLMGIQRLGAKEVRAGTLVTSGTIKQAAKALPESSPARQNPGPKRG